jgi:hypothetical protein
MQCQCQRPSTRCQMIDGFASAANLTGTARSGRRPTDNGDDEAEGEDTTRVVGGRASGNISLPAQTLDAATAHAISAILSNSFMNDARLEDGQRRCGDSSNWSFRRSVIIVWLFVACFASPLTLLFHELGEQSTRHPRIGRVMAFSQTAWTSNVQRRLASCRR